jgi:hypothetical protein
MAGSSLRIADRGEVDRHRLVRNVDHGVGHDRGVGDMGYGFGIFLIAAGLILALAVSDRIEGVDLTMIGYILAGAGVVIVIITAIQANAKRTSTTTATTTQPDGSQVTQQRTTDRQDPPPVA